MNWTTTTTWGDYEVIYHVKEKYYGISQKMDRC